MTLFKISCDTCQTNLNVRQESAIGQILACPKCGSMVQVTPPTDWKSSQPADVDDGAQAKEQKPSLKRPFKKPIPDPNLPETQSSMSGSVSEGLQEKLQRRADEKAASGDKTDSGGRWQGTDEVTDAAEKTEASKDNGDRKDGSHEKQPSTRSGSDANAVIAPPKQDDGKQDSSKPDPVLPGDQWSSAKSRQQKKMLMIFVSTAAILIFGVGAIVFAAMQLGKSGADDNGQKIAETNDTENSNPETNLASTNKSEKETANSNSEGKKKPLNSDATGTSSAPKTDQDTENNPENNGSKQLNPTTDDTPPEPNPQTSNDSSSGGNGNDMNKNQSENSSEKNDHSNPDSSNRAVASNTNGTDAATDPNVPFEDNKPDVAVKGIFDDINDFAVFETDAELLRARNQFQENDLAGTYGATRFFVERSLKKMPDPDRSLKVRIEAVKFQQATLLEFLDFFYQGTGVTVAVDVTPIILAGIRLDEKFDLLTNGKTFVEILRTVADRRGLQLLENGNNSLILTIPDRDTLIAKEHPAGDLVTTKEELQTLMGLIQQYINKETWSLVGGKGIITANEKNNSIFVEHFGWAQVRVAEILRHIRAAKGLKITARNPNLTGNINRLEVSNGAKEKTITIVESNPISLSRLFANLAKSQDLHVFINWEATGDRLLPSGSLPLSIENETVDQIISELAESMKLEVVWHSANVVELTTELGASSNLTFESYDISKSVQPGSTPDRLLAAIKKLLTENKIADFKKAEIGLDPVDKKTLYAVLPQEAHLNVRRIVSYLESK